MELYGCRINIQIIPKDRAQYSAPYNEPRSIRIKVKSPGSVLFIGRKEACHAVGKGTGWEEGGPPDMDIVSGQQ